MTHVDVGGHRLRVETRGSGTPVFLCLHGLVDTLDVWDHTADVFAARGRLVRVDQRAHGESEAPPGPCSRADLAADVVGLLDALDIPRAVLVGHSMGGIVAMSTALLAPERVAGLVLIGTASRCNEKTAAWYERIAAAGERDGTPGIARAIYGRDTRRTVRGNAAGIAAVTRMLTSLHTDPLTPQLGNVGVPALLVVGETDPMGPRASETIRDALGDGDASLAVVPGCGHWVHVEAPGALRDALDHWLPRLGA